MSPQRPNFHFLSSRKAFTLIELMMVVAIIGLLASIAMPKFANLIQKSKEAQVLGKLGALRSAVTLYYSDTEGFYPQDESGLVPKYISEIPEISVPFGANGRHDSSNVVTSLNDDQATGAWLYDGATGILNVNCTHTDTKGSYWSRY